MNERRYRRICQMMAMRQPDLTICLEEIHKPHNVSAIVRSADAVGIHQIHAIWPDQKVKLSVSSAAGSNSWVKVISHQSTEEAISQIKSQNMQVLVTNLSEQAVDFREIDYTRPTCIMMGQEKRDLFNSTEISRSTHYYSNGWYGSIPECLCRLGTDSL